MRSPRPARSCARSTPPAAAQTDARGAATLRLPARTRARSSPARLGSAPDTLRLVLRAGAGHDASSRGSRRRSAELEAVVVAATRGERRVEDTPLRVEVDRRGGDRREGRDDARRHRDDAERDERPARADHQPVARRRERARAGAARPLHAAPRRRAAALRRAGGRARAAADPAGRPRARRDHQGHRVRAVRQLGAGRRDQPRRRGGRARRRSAPRS